MTGTGGTITNATKTPGGVVGLLRSVLPFVAVIGVALLLQLVLRPVLNDFYAKLLLDIGTNIILAVSLTMVNGFTGQFSMGHAAFMMVGGYVAGSIVYYGGFRLFGHANVAGGTISTMLSGREVTLATSGDLLFLGALIAGGLAAALCGYLVGLPSLRLKGDYLAIVTLGFGEIVRVLIQSQTKDVLYDPSEVAALPVHKWPLYSGGSLGFSGLPFYSSLFWAWLFAGLTLVVAYRLKSSSMGRAFLSIREDEVAAGAMGIDTTKYKIRAFVLSAALAGVAGGIFAHTVGVQLNPGELGFQKSFDIIIMVVLGGLGSISGASIAAIILSLLPEGLRDPEKLLRYWWVFALAALIGAIGASAGRRVNLIRAIGRFSFMLGAAGLLLCVMAWLVQRHNASLPPGGTKIELAQYRIVLYALMLILVMILKPDGIMGLREVWDLWRPRRGKGGA